MSKSMIHISQNGRYFLDEKGAPFFWLGDTQWNLFRCHTLEEARAILVNRRDKGFTVIQVMLLGFEREVMASAVYGEAFPEKDPTSPNPDYFEHVDAIVKLAWENGIILAIGLDHPVVRLVDKTTARAYGRWIGERYRDYPNIIWVATYLIPEGENLEIMREISQGLREGEGETHLITCHPDPAQPVATSGISHQEEWLDFNCIQTFSSIDLICDSVAADYRRFPPKPVVMAEGAYEAGPEYGYEVTPYLVRKQAYLSYFAGGHHSYGHTDNWRVSPAWKAALDAAGAEQMTVLRDIFTSMNWWELVPDQSIFEDDGDGECKALCTQKGDLLMVYCCSPSTFTVNMNKMTASGVVTAAWIDPRSGERAVVGALPVEGTHVFRTPEQWEDAILLIE